MVFKTDFAPFCDIRKKVALSSLWLQRMVTSTDLTLICTNLTEKCK